MARVLVRVDTKLVWDVRRYKSGDYLAICDPIGLTIQAETWAELMESIASTLDSMLRDLLKTNDLDRFMRERGWKIVGPMPRVQKDVRFDVPFFTKMMKSHGPQRTVYQ